jgi:hypothetical protein
MGGHDVVQGPGDKGGAPEYYVRVTPGRSVNELSIMPSIPMPQRRLLMNLLSRFSLIAFLAASASSITGCTVYETRPHHPDHEPPPPPAAAPVTPAPVAPAPAAPAAGAHPAYLHALSDLREARGNLERKGGDGAMKWDEHVAINAVDRAIAEIKHAAIDDGKNLEDHPAVDAHEPRAGRLHKALAALRTARGDIEHEEDNASVRGLRNRAIGAIDDAIHATEDGIKAAAASS